jgi:hypothetical protein
VCVEAGGLEGGGGGGHGGEYVKLSREARDLMWVKVNVYLSYDHGGGFVCVFAARGSECR